MSLETDSLRTTLYPCPVEIKVIMYNCTRTVCWCICPLKVSMKEMKGLQHNATVRNQSGKWRKQVYEYCGRRRLVPRDWTARRRISLGSDINDFQQAAHNQTFSDRALTLTRRQWEIAAFLHILTFICRQLKGNGCFWSLIGLF